MINAVCTVFLRVGKNIFRPASSRSENDENNGNTECFRADKTQAKESLGEV